MSVSISLNIDRSRKQSPYPDGDPDRHRILFIGSLPTFAENFMQIPLEVFAKVANTNKRWQKHILLGGGNNHNNSTSFTIVDHDRRP